MDSISNWMPACDQTLFTLPKIRRMSGSASVVCIAGMVSDCIRCTLTGSVSTGRLAVLVIGFQSGGRCRDQTSFDSGLACPPASQSLSLKTKTECSCRAFQQVVVSRRCQSLPSALCQTSPKLSFSFDQPPSTHRRPRYAAALNHIRGSQGADVVSRVQFTPSPDDHTSFFA